MQATILEGDVFNFFNSFNFFNFHKSNIKEVLASEKL